MKHITLMAMMLLACISIAQPTQNSTLIFKPPMAELKITQTPLEKGQFFEQETPKTTLVLHHTAGAGTKGDLVKWFNADPRRVATAYGLTRMGELEQLFPDKFWASAINTKNAAGKQIIQLEKQALQIELYSWGALTLNPAAGTYHNWTAWKQQPNGNFTFNPTRKNEVKNVCLLEFRGADAFEAYSPEQISILGDWITAKMEEHNIPRAGLLAGNISAADFELNQTAINGFAGCWAHSNYRQDKSDLAPQPILLEMLNSI